MVTDASLIENTLKGETQAFSGLVSKYRGEIYSVVKAIIHNPDDADDLTQDVFIQAYKKLPQLKDKNKFLPWVKQIARNQARRWLQRPRLDLLPLEEAQAEPTLLAPDEQLLRKELLEAIMQAIDSLPELDKQIVHAYLDGMSHKQIAKESGISYQASMNRLHRAKKNIAEKIKQLIHAFALLPKILPFKKNVSGGILAMKIGTSMKVTVGVIGVLVAGFIGFNILTHQSNVKTEKTPISAQHPLRRITTPKFVTHKPKTITQVSPKEEIPIPEEVPTAQNSDDEIRSFLDWLLSLEKEETSGETEIGDSDVEDEHEPEIDYDREKSRIESVIFQQWERGYETFDVELYMSSIWEDDFFYTSDIGTPGDPSDDIIYRGGQREREGATRTFSNFDEIELNIYPRSDIEFLSDTLAMVEYDYELMCSLKPSSEGISETSYPSGRMTFILEHRNNDGTREWRILEWYDYADYK